MLPHIPLYYLRLVAYNPHHNYQVLTGESFIELDDEVSLALRLLCLQTLDDEVLSMGGEDLTIIRLKLH